ncbi:hypothetical protein RI845_17410 [Thalassotalea nanhaiensis]|uniref:DUF4878 domain-containing protein n=1 Tax=Thalassotalea nanhaiensis TaxID=3065648 RepID=A0ABY9THL5_9GAMM|nr:hypothetical protein RI845_17410 [Colwelliaceae bacterium SQ345]
MENILKNLILIILISVSGCSFDATVHDERAAAKNALQILDSMIYKADAETVYNSSTQAFKDSVPYNDFQYLVDQIAYSYSHSDIKVIGYEIYGTSEEMTIYATSQSNVVNFHYAITFNGTQSKGYKLQHIRFKDKIFDKNGIYKDFSSPLTSDTDNNLNRTLKLNNGNEVTIEGVTKTLIQNEGKYVYTVKYFTATPLESIDEIESEASLILESFAAPKTINSGLKDVAMTATNESRFENPTKNLKVYRTVFQLTDGAWKRW